MKITKSILILIAVIFFISTINISSKALELTEEEKKIVQELRKKKGRTCSNPKGFHEKRMCKKDPTFLDKKNLNTAANREEFKADMMKILKKIKDYGGSKVGEAD